MARLDITGVVGGRVDPAAERVAMPERGLLEVSPGALFQPIVSESAGTLTNLAPLEDPLLRNLLGIGQSRSVRVEVEPQAAVGINANTVYKVIERRFAGMDFAPLPAFRRDHGPGGIASLRCGNRGCSAIPLDTLRSEPVRLDELCAERDSNAHLFEFASEVARQIRPGPPNLSCGYAVPIPGGTRCTYYPDGTVAHCEHAWKQQCVEWPKVAVCIGNDCREYGNDVSLSSNVYKLLRGEICTHFGDVGSAQGIDAGLAAVAVDPARADIEALFLTRGLYFEQLVAEAENRSLRQATIDVRWRRLLRVLEQFLLAPAHERPSVASVGQHHGSILRRAGDGAGAGGAPRHGTIASIKSRRSSNGPVTWDS